MKITLNAKRIVFLGISSLLLGFLLFVSGMVVGSKIDPAQLQQQARLPRGARLPLETLTSKVKTTGAAVSTAAGAGSEKVKKQVAEKTGVPETPGEKKETPAGQETPAPVKTESPAVTGAAKDSTPGTGPSAKSPAAASAEPPPLSEAPKISSHDAFTVQVGAFLEKVNAEKMLTDLKKRGYSPYILTIWDPRRRQWHTVRLGNYTTLKQAGKVAEDFIEKERMAAAVRGIGVL